MGWSRTILRAVPVGALGGLVVSKILSPYADALVARSGLTEPSTVDSVLTWLAVFLTSTEVQFGLALIAAFGAGAWLDKVLAVREKREETRLANLGTKCIGMSRRIDEIFTGAWVDGPPFGIIRPQTEALLHTIEKAGFAVPKRDAYPSDFDFYWGVSRHLGDIGHLLEAGHKSEAINKAKDLSVWPPA